MAVDTVTLALTGDVALGDFSEALERLHSLLRELSREVAEGARITWMVDSLEAGSAVAAVRGVAVDGTQISQIESVVRVFGQVGESLERGRKVPYSGAVERE